MKALIFYLFVFIFNNIFGNSYSSALKCSHLKKLMAFGPIKNVNPSEPAKPMSSQIDEFGNLLDGQEKPDILLDSFTIKNVYFVSEHTSGTNPKFSKVVLSFDLLDEYGKEYSLKDITFVCIPGSYSKFSMSESPVLVLYANRTVGSTIKPIHLFIGAIENNGNGLSKFEPMAKNFVLFNTNRPLPKFLFPESYLKTIPNIKETPSALYPQQLFTSRLNSAEQGSVMQELNSYLRAYEKDNKDKRIISKYNDEFIEDSPTSSFDSEDSSYEDLEKAPEYKLGADVDIFESFKKNLAMLIRRK